GGNGGNAEVSSKDVLAFTGVADLRAPFGKWGTLLLDPGALSIDRGAAATIATNLNTADVSISGESVDVQASITYGGATSRSLSLAATNGTLTVEPGVSITSTTSALNVSLTATTGVQLSGASVETHGGNLS